MKKVTQVLSALLCVFMIFSIVFPQVSADKVHSQTEINKSNQVDDALLTYCNSDVEAYSSKKCFYVALDSTGAYMMDYEQYSHETEYREYLTEEEVDQIAYLSGVLYYHVPVINEIKQINLSTMEKKKVVRSETEILRFAANDESLLYLSQNTIYSVNLKDGTQKAIVSEPMIQRFWLADELNLEYITDDEETVNVYNLKTHTTTQKVNSISSLVLDEAGPDETPTRGISIATLKTKFPHGKYWNHALGEYSNPDGYTGSPCGSCHNGHNGCYDGYWNGNCSCNSFDGAIQCFGYALKVAYDYYDSNPRYWTAVYNLDSLKAGDYIRYKRDADNPSGRHSIWVTAVNGDTITYTDCNSTGRCQIRWEGTISKSTVISTLAYVWTAPTPSSGEGLSASTDSKVYSVGNTATFSFNASGANSLHLYIYYNGALFFEGQFSPEATYQRTIPYAGHYAYYIVAHYPTGDVESSWDDFQAVSPPTVSADASNYIVGSTATFSFTAQGASSVHLYIYYAGSKLFEGQYSPNATYQRVLSGAGHYAYYMIAHYDMGDIQTEWGEFQAVEQPIVSSDKTDYYLGDVAMFSFTAPLATSVHLYIYKGEEKYFEGQYSPSATYQRNLTDLGDYTYYIIGHYPMGDVESAHKPFSVSCNHSYTYIVTTAPTTSAAGTLNGTCSNCGNTTNITLPKLTTADYNYSVVTPATCTVNGVGRYTWKTTTYGTFSFDVTIPKTGHSYVDTVTAPTCTEQGYTTHTCSACGDSYVDSYVNALGHAWGSWTQTIAPTCMAPGEEARTCTRCGETESRHINALGHNYQDVVTQPTCTAQGYTTHTCSRCGDSYVDSYVNALGHAWGSWTQTTAPTCTEPGALSRNCSRCGETETSPISPLGHDWKAPEYVWANDNTSVTATRVCKRDSEHMETEKVSTTSQVILEPTADQDGMILYIAVFTNTAFQMQTKTAVLPKLAQENPFVDVKETDWYFDPVLWAFYHVPQITNGTDATHFSPNKNCTRAQVVTFLWRACGEPEPTVTENPFTDVRTKDYFYKAVLWAVEQGITNGTSSTTFGPNKECTRGQVVTFMWRAAGEPEPTAATNPFADVRTKDYFYRAVMWAVENGITNGMDATHFKPNKTCTRAQVVTFLYRAYN